MRVLEKQPIQQTTQVTLWRRTSDRDVPLAPEHGVFLRRLECQSALVIAGADLR
jgi:hypothetical protein